MNATVSIDCPCCETPFSVRVNIDPGEPAITSGPADNWYPGSGPTIQDWQSFDDVEYNCSCRVALNWAGKVYVSMYDDILAALLQNVTDLSEAFDEEEYDERD